MRRTGQSVWGHPHASAVFSNRSRNASGSSCGPIFCTGMWVGGAGAVGLPPARTSRSIQLRNSSRSSRWFWTRAQNPFLVRPHVQQRFMMFLVESRERLDDFRKWRSRRCGHDGSGIPASFPGFRHQCNKVRKKEGSGQGWLVKTRVVLFKQINLNRCAICAS